jgi:hypothetical protein
MLKLPKNGENLAEVHSLCISQIVLDEVARGDSEIAVKRLELLKGLSLVGLNQSVRDLSVQFLIQSNLPPKASDDAVHIAAATVHGMDYLLTWNCKHIANAQIQKSSQKFALTLGMSYQEFVHLMS